jgi:hypothetical protein
MVRINIPAYCTTCGAIFPSGISFSDGSKNIVIKNCHVGPCPNGHMGRIMDGTFDIIEGILNLKNAGPVSQEVLAKIKALAQNAESGNTDPKVALDEIAEFLPRDSAAAIKKLGAQNPLVAILILLAIVNGLAGSVGGLVTAYRTLNPSAPISRSYHQQ